MIDIGRFARIAKNIRSAATSTPNLGLKKMTFSSGGREFVAIQQNPNTNSRWASLARQGKQVVQFKDQATDRYVAVSVDGEVTVY